MLNWVGGQAIAIAALGHSCYTSYRDQDAPFDPTYAAGPIILQFGRATETNREAFTANGSEFDPVVGRVLGPVLVGLTVTHGGGQNGVVNHVSLRASRLGFKDAWEFMPRLFLDEQATATADPNPYLKFTNGAFGPFAVSKGREVRKTILFQPNESEHFPGGRLRVGTYAFEVRVKIDAQDYVTVHTFEIDMSREALKNNDGVGRWAPMP